MRFPWLGPETGVVVTVKPFPSGSESFSNTPGAMMDRLPPSDKIPVSFWATGGAAWVLLTDAISKLATIARTKNDGLFFTVPYLYEYTYDTNMTVSFTKIRLLE